MRKRTAVCIFWGAMLWAARIQSQQATTEMDEHTKEQVKQLRAISDVIKACPKVALFADKGTGTLNDGPPFNVTWDVKPNSSIRAPYLGYIEFVLPRQFSASEAYCATHRKSCDDLMSLNSFRYRFEFDLGSDRLELTKMLVKSDYEKDKEWHDARPDESCWQKAARSGKRSKARNARELANLPSYPVFHASGLSPAMS